MKNKRFSKFLVLSILIVFLLSGCNTKYSQNPKLIKEVQFVLGTTGQIQVYSESEETGQESISKTFNRIRDIENKMSTSIEGSDVYRLNENKNSEYINIDEETIYVINKGLEYYYVTSGAFNINIGALINLWGIGKETARIPSEQEITDALQHIDIDTMAIKNNSVMLEDPLSQIELGGIAKGYAVDEATRMLREEGINNALVNLGGDIYALGKRYDGKPWTVGIQDPEQSSKLIASLPLTDQSIVTSGDYERYFMEDGVRYHHIIDPETGYPVRNELRSVTIISDLAIDGDVLSTAVFILGLEKGLELIESLDGVEVILITNEKEIYHSSGVNEQLNIINKEYKIREFK